MSRQSETRVLITGGDGFVAPFAARAIQAGITDARILFSARQRIAPPAGCEFANLDVLQAENVARVIGDFRPSHVLHLAGIASRNSAERDPGAAWRVNVEATVSLAGALLLQCPGSTFVFVGSSQIYDASAVGPLTESSPIAPDGVYAATKAAADAALGEMAVQDLRVVRLRPFNHTGPGQSALYAFGSFAAQIAAIEASLQPAVLKVGNLQVARDFLDVRDIARAYALAIARSAQLPNGIAINLGSGRPRKLGELLKVMVSAARVKIAIEVDPALWRPDPNFAIGGDFSRAQAVLGWRPEIDIEDTVKEMLDFARKQI